MWHRRERVAKAERSNTKDPVSSAVWEQGHLTGDSTQSPVIKAPLASELVLGVTDAA